MIQIFQAVESELQLLHRELSKRLRFPSHSIHWIHWIHWIHRRHNIVSFVHVYTIIGRIKLRLFSDSGLSLTLFQRDGNSRMIHCIHLIHYTETDRGSKKRSPQLRIVRNVRFDRGQQE